MSNIVTPEFAVRDWRKSKHFYCAILGFTCLYERPEEGFCAISYEEAELMLDQIGLGRSFGSFDLPASGPLGLGVNIQIEVSDITPLLAALKRARYPLVLPPEERWYRIGNKEEGNRQFIVADPDGYLLRFFSDIGTRLWAQA